MRRVATLALIGLTVITGACGDGDSSAPSRPRVTTPTTTTESPPLDETDRELSEELWHSGFRVELTRAEVWTSTTFLTNRTQYWLTLWGDFENRGNEAAAFDPEMAIVESGAFYTHRREDPPRVLPESQALGKLTFLISEALDFDAAEFVVGAPDESQVRIPLGSQGAAVRLEPTRVLVSGRTQAELVDFDFTSGVLQYDLPDEHRQLKTGEMALTLYFDVANRSSQDARIKAEDIELILADGTAVPPSIADLDSLPAGADGGVAADRFISFVVGELPSGDLTLRIALDGPLVGEDGVTEATFDFSL